MSFTRKILSFTFTLPSGTFQGTGSNTLTVSGLKASISMRQQGGVTQDQVSIVIWGLTTSQMNQMSTFGVYPDLTKNAQITVQAGDTTSGLSTVFIGTIRIANADYSAQPNVAFVVEASANHYLAVAPAPPLSFNGTADVAVIIGNLAGQIGMTLENSGVSVKLSNPYFCRSAVDQIMACAKHANINVYIDTKMSVVAIWPKGQSRNGQLITIAPGKGLVGYPTFSAPFVTFRTEFNPSIVFGRDINVQSSLKTASGTFTPMWINTTLQTETQGGAWFQDIQAYAKPPQ
jgi:hypothetical protein